jgi:two-component system phosphate regulon response regulator PhoB
MDQTANNRIMIIGGDSHFSYLMQRYIRNSAHNIIFADLGGDVLAQARCEKPVAIILAVEPPESVGWHFLQVLKSDLEVGKIPVIVCSWVDDETHCLELGADFYLHMPILFADFESALIATLSKDQNEKSYQ